ncbi:MAG: nucleoside phosphorylase [Chloroflexia bacterium]
MSFPNLPGKHLFEPLVTPERMLEHLRASARLEEFVVPHRAYVLFQRPLLRRVLELESPERTALDPLGVYSLPRSVGKWAVATEFGVGAPVLATVVERLSALGTREFVILGIAGALQPDARAGDVVLCDRAIRDEGTSHHYVAPGKYATPSTRLTAELRERLRRASLPFAEGATWTTDAPYRETVEEVVHYRDEGVLTVEMEASALFAICERKGLEGAAAFVVSDILREEGWEPRFGATSAPQPGGAVPRRDRLRRAGVGSDAEQSSDAGG